MAVKILTVTFSSFNRIPITVKFTVYLKSDDFIYHVISSRNTKTMVEFEFSNSWYKR